MKEGYTINQVPSASNDSQDNTLTSKLFKALKTRGASGIATKAIQYLASKWKLRKCNKTGTLCTVAGRIAIANYGTIILGNRVRFRASHLPIELGTCPGGVLTVGDTTFINSGVSIGVQERVTIGSNCAIGNLCIIMDSDFHSPDDHTKWPEAKPVTIEDNVWLGARVTVLKGVTIGTGAVVAAGAVVTKDVAPRTLVAGVPARFIRNLKSND